MVTIAMILLITKLHDVIVITSANARRSLTMALPALLLLSLLVVPLPTIAAAEDDDVPTTPIKLPNGTVVPAVIGFGDSIIDPGNNNYIKTLVKCDFPPYGQDFMGGGRPTGRFSNGKIPTDFLVAVLGVKEIMPAYLDPSLSPSELLTGVSFASGAAGFDPLTSQLASAIPMTRQLELFKEYISKLKAIVGEDRTNFIITNSIYLVVAGSDDIANTYFDIPIVRKDYDHESYTNLMLDGAASFVQELYNLGARRIGVFGTPPIGCVPSQRTLGGGLLRECAGEYNDVAQMYNSKLENKLGFMRNTLSGSRVTYIDIYTPLLDMIQNPQKFGFDVVNKGCCGTGLIEVTLLCNEFDSVCEDPPKYLFWDSYHPTERAYRIFVNNVINKYVNQLI